MRICEVLKKMFVIQEFFDKSETNERKRKRKSRWGEKDTSIPPPVVALPSQTPPGGTFSSSQYNFFATH